MNKVLTSVIKWAAPCVLFIFRDEILSLLALIIMGMMCLTGLIAERERCRE